MIESNNNVPSGSYVTAAKSRPKPVFPKKEQAIVIHSHQNLVLFDYVKAIGDLVSPKNVCFASKISNNRICIYLSKTELVDQLIRDHPTIYVNSLALPIRRLVTPAKRILISNVCPSIPDELVEKALIDFGLHLVSPISFLKAGIPGDEYAHIMSFRRQVYVTPTNDNFELQTSLLLTHDNTAYRIFLSTDRMECFLCKQHGHIATKCPNTITPSLSQNSQPIQVSNTISTTLTDSQQNEMPPLSSHDATVITLPITPTEDNQLTSSFITPSQKRPHSPSCDTISLCESQSVDGLDVNVNIMPPPKIPPTNCNDTTKSIKKRARKESSEELSLSDSTKDAIHNLHKATPKDFTLSADHIISFLENSFGSSNPLHEAQQFTKDVEGLLNDLQQIYPCLIERSIKNRLTRLSKKINKCLLAENTSMDTLSQQSDDYLSDSSQASQKSTY